MKRFLLYGVCYPALRYLRRRFLFTWFDRKLYAVYYIFRIWGLCCRVFR